MIKVANSYFKVTATKMRSSSYFSLIERNNFGLELKLKLSKELRLTFFSFQKNDFLK